MKFVKVVFLFLVAVGICGALYFGLYAGMRMAGLTLAETRPSQEASGGAGASAAAAEPEDPAELLQRRLNTLKPDEALPGSFVAAPQPPPPSAGGTAGILVPMPYRTWLPRAEAVARPLPGDTSLRALRARPALDVPPLADAALAAPRLPPVRLAAAPAFAVASPDPAQVPVNSIARAAPTDLPDLTTDPAPDESRRAAVRKMPALRQTPAPFVRISLPDPSPQGDAPAPKNAPADDADAPVAAPGLPGRVTLR
jgi:hypothetical protein